MIMQEHVRHVQQGHILLEEQQPLVPHAVPASTLPRALQHALRVLPANMTRELKAILVSRAQIALRALTIPALGAHQIWSVLHVHLENTVLHSAPQH